MIKGKFNLACEDGHHYYAPRPDEWVGKSCGRQPPGGTRAHGCPNPLFLIKNPR